MKKPVSRSFKVIVLMLMLQILVISCKNNNSNKPYSAAGASNSSTSQTSSASTGAPNSGANGTTSGPSSSLTVAPTVPPSSGIATNNNLMLFGDEWITRLDIVSKNNLWSASPSPTSMGYNLSLFWQDALQQITSNPNFQGNVKPGANQVLFALFSDFEHDVYSPSEFITQGLPYSDFLNNYHFTNYQKSNNISPDPALSLESLLNYNAIILVSYSRALDPQVLSQYIQRGGGVMVFPIGFGYACPDPANPKFNAAGGDPTTTTEYYTANFECLNMNSYLMAAQFPYQFDCGNQAGNLQNLANSPYFSNIQNPSQTLPFEKGYTVINAGGPQTTANFCQ